jgi:predicted O-methyltransferase YrrM
VRQDEIYERGYAEGEDGSRQPLDPHALSRNEADGLRRLAVDERVSSTLEVGLGLGMGALSLCSALREVGHAGARHVVVEPYPDDFGGAGRRALSDAGVDGVVELVAEESQLALPRLAAEGRSFDLALIDGDHRFDGVFLDVCFADRLVRPRGLIVVDDMGLTPVRLAVSYAERNLGWQLMPEGMPGAFRWRRVRTLPGRRLRGSGNVAVLRRPEQRPGRADWDRFVPFA